MPKTKHHKKKYPNSEWVRRRNIRKAAASKQSSSKPVVDMVDSSEPIKETPLKPQKDKPKGFIQKSLAGIKNVFVNQKENSKSVV